METLGFIPNIGPWQWLILLVIALLLFGRRLPEVGRSLGRSIVEFRKGIKGIEEEVEAETRKAEERAKPPLTSGQDVRVSRTDPVEPAEGSAEGGARV